MAGKSKSRMAEEKACLDPKADRVDTLFITNLKDIIVHSQRVLFSCLVRRENQEVYISEATASCDGVRFKVNIGYTLFNKGDYMYDAIISTLTIIEAHNPMGQPMKVGISNSARLELVRMLSDSEVSQLRDIIDSSTIDFKREKLT